MKRIVVHPALGEIETERCARSRSIRLSVRGEGRIRLSYPWHVSLARALQFLDTKTEWVAAALERRKAAQDARIIRPPYSTRRHTLRLLPDVAGRITVRVAAGTIAVRYPASLDTADEQLQQAVRKGITEAMRREAREILPPMTESVSRRTGLPFRSVTVRAMSSKWGSCSSRNDLSLSVYLMALPDHLIEYVIVHELCHTVHHDHSLQFHALVDKLLGGRKKELNRELKNYRPL